MRRIRDTGLSPFLWLVFPISLILGEFTQILAMIISVILAIIYLVFTLLPSKNSKIAPYSQIRGSLIATIGLLVLVIFSVGHLPAKAEQIAQSQMTTKITVKTTMREELKFPTNLSAAGKQSLIEIYTTPRGNEEGWKLSSDQSYVYRDVTPENEPIIIDGKTHTTNDDGIVDTKANATESKMSMSTPNAEVMSFSVVPSLTTKKATSENFTLLAGIKYNNGALVTCNRFNGFLGNQLYYDKFKQPVEALKNFFASDCDFAIAKSNSCFADYGAVKNRYCALGSGVPSYKNGQCSKFIHHSTRFHKHTSYYK